MSSSTAKAFPGHAILSPSAAKCLLRGTSKGQKLTFEINFKLLTLNSFIGFSWIQMSSQHARVPGMMMANSRHSGSAEL